MPLSVSIGQAACNALAAWLRTALTSDVIVFERWPEASEDLFSTGSTPARAVVTIVRVGARTRLSVVSLPTIDAISAIVAGQFTVTFRVGAFIQPVQLDVWAKTDDDRDDIIAQLDVALTAGVNATIPSAPAGDDPVRDGVLVAMNPSDGFAGNIDFFLDEPAITDSPESVARSEYRATYFGEARGPFVRSVLVPPMLALKLKQQLYVGAPIPGALYDATVLNANPTPPPAYTITHDREP